MDKDAWRHTWSSLGTTCSRLEADIAKHADGPLLKGVLDAGDSQSHANTFKHLTDARQQLVELQELVLGEGQANTTFIAALSERITSFTQKLNSIKQQQRSSYASLLQEEQQLLEDLAVLELTLTDEQQQQPEAVSAQHDASPFPAPGQHTAAWQSSCSPHNSWQDPQHISRQHSKAASSSGRGSDSASDCVHRSPDRPSRQPGSSSSPVKTPAPDSSSLPPEVQSHDAFVARHGATGGWHPDDHKTFMTLLKSHRGDYNAALAAIVDALPLQTRQTVIQHCRWHADLCELDMRKRIALVNWRTAKEAAKAAFRAQALALGDTATAAGGTGLEPVVANPADQQKGVRQMKQQLVQQWKEEQAAARQEAIRAAQEQRQLQQQQEQQRRQKRQEDLKRQLQEAKAARREQEALAAAKQAQQAQSAVDPEQRQRQRLQQRNAAALERQRQLLLAKQAKQAEREQAQQQLLAAAHQMRPQVDRDPSRLLSATTAAAARAAATAASAADSKEAAAQSSRGRAAAGFVLHVGHKATPNWVEGLQGL